MGKKLTMKKIIKEIFFNSKVGTYNTSNRETWLKDKISLIPENSRILDAGAGELQYKKLCTHLDYVSQDFAQYDGIGNEIGLQQQKWDVSKIDIISDISSIPEPSLSFDAIMCIEVFEHIPDPILAIKEFARLLKKDGTLIITAPFCSLTHFAPFHFSSGFNRYYYEKHLIDFGFEIKEITPNGNFFEFLGQELRRTPEITARYTNIKLKWMDKLKFSLLLKLLQKLSTNDTKSNEVLCFGYHILARKK